MARVTSPASAATETIARATTWCRVDCDIAADPRIVAAGDWAPAVATALLLIATRLGRDGRVPAECLDGLYLARCLGAPAALATELEAAARRLIESRALVPCHDGARWGPESWRECQAPRCAPACEPFALVPPGEEPRGPRRPRRRSGFDLVVDAWRSAWIERYGEAPPEPAGADRKQLGEMLAHDRPIDRHPSIWVAHLAYAARAYVQSGDEFTLRARHPLRLLRTQLARYLPERVWRPERAPERARDPLAGGDEARVGLDRAGADPEPPRSDVAK